MHQLLHTLGDEIRREVVHDSENTCDGSSVGLDTLVEHIAARVSDVDERALRTCLWHQHLPVLRERGWIEFDYRNERIRYHGNDEARRDLLNLVDVFE